MMIRFEKASPSDAAALTAVQKYTFDDDSRRFLGTPCGGPPGYDSERWQLRMMIQAAAYYKILDDERIIGGMIIFDMGGGHLVLGRIWIDPGWQDRGIGRQAMQFIEHTFPQAQHWTLDTPDWATRNHHFYEAVGYTKAGEKDGMFIYEKKIP